MLRINLNLLCCEMLGTERYMPTIPKSPALRESESEVIEAIRDGKHDAVKVKLHAGKIDLIDKTKQVGGAAKIVDLLQEVGHGDLVINVANGKATHTVMSQKKRQKK